MKAFFSICLLSLLRLAAPGQTSNDTVCILQLNDVYEIGPLNQGKQGGMAKVATIIKGQEARYQTFVVLAGDFVSPSVIGTTRIDSQRVNGRHMVDIMNKAGVDLVTFGNHEFDIPEKDLQQRINESHFAWVSSDVRHRNATGEIAPFYKTKPDSVAIPAYYLLPSANHQFTIGIVSATLPSNPQPWVVYNNNIKYMKKAVRQVRKQSDLVVALTHLALADDKRALKKIRRIRLVMGGHEHKNNYVEGRRGVITKADANAKSMYRHLVFRDSENGKIRIISNLVAVDSTVEPDPQVAADVKTWEDRSYKAFRDIGLEPNDPVYQTTEPLDGTEAHMRHQQTNLGALIAQAMLAASPQSVAAVFNSGSIRVDDMIEGAVTQLDIIRTLPFGGKLCEVDLDGALLSHVLATSNGLKGLGGYLQVSPNLVFDGTNWLLNEAAIEGSRSYSIVCPEFLLAGLEKGLEFFKEGASGINAIRRFDAAGDPRSDIRLAVVRYLQGLAPKPGN